MAKLYWKPATLLYPVPVVLVSCGTYNGIKNIITIAWAGTVASDPVMVTISVRPERFSYSLIKNSGEFVINLPNRKLVRAVDFCGVKSGREVDKFTFLGLTSGQTKTVQAPLIVESPLSLECKVVNMISLGSHDLFIAKVLGVQVDEFLVEPNGRLNLDKAGLITYVHGQYWSLKAPLGNFGYSIRKKPKK